MGEIQHRIGNASSRQNYDFTTQLFGKVEGTCKRITAWIACLTRLRRFDVDDIPWSVKICCQPMRDAYKSFCISVRSHTSHDTSAGAPGTSNRLSLHVAAHIFVNTSGGITQRQFPQRQQISSTEEAVHRLFCLVGDIDFAFSQPLLQRFGRDIDDLDLACQLEDVIRYCLLLANAGDLVDNVNSTLNVLNVEGRKNADACIQQFLHILEPLLVSAPWKICVSKFIYQNNGWFACKDSVKIQIIELETTIDDGASRDNLQILDKRLSFCSPMSLDEADNNIYPLVLEVSCFFEHPVRLADAGGVAEVYLQVTLVVGFLVCFFLLQTMQKYVRVRPLFLVHIRVFLRACPRQC